ncbi:MAG: PAS domain-containing protein [Deltaproteobacteria bacterium]|nr:PAS domain-containing protein [Deltaproteobacteria bacterium]MBN2670427.1 PAS domain-containing protein [Deltaproteobacteria bacterium]
MWTEVTYSTQVFLPSLIAGVLLLSAAVMGFLYVRLRQSVYLASAVASANSCVFVLMGAIINFCSDNQFIELGMQLSRIEQLLGAAFIPIIPWLIYSFGSLWMPTVQRTVIAVSAAVFAAFVVISFATPDLFVSITQSAGLKEMKEASLARGLQGPLYAFRDGMLAVAFVYGLWVTRRLLFEKKIRKMAWTVLIAMIAAMSLSLNDMVNSYTQHKKLFWPVFDFAYSALGLGIFGVIIAVGTFRLFVEQLGESEQNLNRTGNLLRDVVNTMDSVVVGLDEAYQVVLWNRHTIAKTGIAEADALGRPVDAVLPKLVDEREGLNRAIRDKQPTYGEKSMKLPSGEMLYEDFKILPLESGDVSGAVLVATDITEKKKLHETIIQTEKMVSVGGLAAGMAHEINNPLSGMMQNAQVLNNRLLVVSSANQKAAESAGIDFDALRKYMEERRIPSMLEAITNSGVQASKVIRNMLDFSRKETGSIEHVSLSQLLDNVIELAKNDWDLVDAYDFKNIQIVKEYDLSMPTVPCENQHMSQVFFNIIKNASQAMFEAKSGDASVLTIRTVWKDNRRARIEIGNNGPGIPSELRSRIFDPFFTTKGVGKGTGLGLSVSYFIVTERHNGSIDVVCPKGGGTRFIIELPADRHSVSQGDLPGQSNQEGEL